MPLVVQTVQLPASGARLATVSCSRGHRVGSKGHRVGSQGHRVGSRGHRVGSKGHRVGSRGHRVGSRATVWVASLISFYFSL